MQYFTEPLLSPSSRLNRLSNKLGAGGLYIFAFTAWMNKEGAIFGLALILLSCLIQGRTIFRSVRTSPLLWVVIATSLYILTRTIIVSTITEPEYSELHFKDGVRLFYLLGFVLISWVIGADQQRILTVFAIAFTGFVIARLWHFDWTFSMPVPWWKYRTGLGLPAIPFGHYVATAMIGLLIFAPRIFRQFGSQVRRWLAVILWFVLVLMTLEGVILSQSRFVWISLLLMLPVFIYCIWPYLLRLSKIHRALIAIIVFSLGGASVTLNWETLASRATAEPETWQQLFSGRFDEIETRYGRGTGKSVGTRLRMLEYGIDEWLESPVFGRGPAAPKILLANSDIPNFSHLNDLHNGIVEILVRHGAVGLLLLLLCLMYTLRSGWRAYRKGEISSDLYLFLMSGMVLLLLSMLTNYRMLNYDWRYYLFLFSGALASFDLCKGAVWGRQVHSKPEFID